MEISCPDCSQRLRVPDHLTNPLVRCRNCGKTFRPSETAESRIPFAIPMREPEPQSQIESAPQLPKSKSSDSQLHDFLSQPRAEPSVAEQAKTRRSVAGWGTGVIIGLIALRGGVKLVKHLFHEDRKPQPAPVQFDPKLRPDIQKLLEQADPQRRRPQPLPGKPEAPPPESPPPEN